jgi:hypothetical protein
MLLVQRTCDFEQEAAVAATGMRAAAMAPVVVRVNFNTNLTCQRCHA